MTGTTSYKSTVCRNLGVLKSIWFRKQDQGLYSLVKKVSFSKLDQGLYSLVKKVSFRTQDFCKTPEFIMVRTYSSKLIESFLIIFLCVYTILKHPRRIVILIF